jgi:hypothetical protein
VPTCADAATAIRRQRGYDADRRQWIVISGGQLNRAGTIEQPAPTDVTHHIVIFPGNRAESPGQHRKY